jgi:hypothetical protein
MYYICYIGNQQIQWFNFSRFFWSPVKYFVSKIQNIRSSLLSSIAKDDHADALSSDIPFTAVPLNSFHPTSGDEIRKRLLSMPPKPCTLDVVPTSIVRKCAIQFVPFVTDLVNKPLSQSVMPKDFKLTIIKPLLKKHNLDSNELKNYRPVSNLPFLSKVIEKVVATRIEHHLDSNHLHDTLQSAYRSYHSITCSQRHCDRLR